MPFSSNFSHAWNQSYVDGKWIIIDTTWDNNCTRNGRVSNKARHEYFNPDPIVFQSSHTYYIPKPTNDGLKEYYLNLNKEDREFLINLCFKKVDESPEAAAGYHVVYAPVGHMKDGQLYGDVLIEINNGRKVYFTLKKDKNKKWTIIDMKYGEEFLLPTPSYRLDKE